LAVECPANKKTIAHTPRGSAPDVELAVAAAHAAFLLWRRVTPSVRGRALLKVADAIEASVEDLARIIAHETDNALRTQARPEAQTCVEVFRYFGGLGGELKGDTLPLGEDILSYTRREPLGSRSTITRPSWTVRVRRPPDLAWTLCWSDPLKFVDANDHRWVALPPGRCFKKRKVDN
jgi:acyl-CoA reductase-like NAD-dependent aldehyde dehydrogenase